MEQTPRFTQSNWMTFTGRRPDLEVIEVNPPIGYIGDRLYPKTPWRFSSGTLSGMTLPAVVPAQTDRTDGEAPTATLITNAEVEFTCSEMISRYGKTAKQTMDTGDIARVDMQGGAAAKRAMMYDLEKLRLTKLITPVTGNYNLITAAGEDILNLLDQALDSIRLYNGVRVLVMNARMLQKLGRCLSLTQFYGAAPVERSNSLLNLKNRIVSAFQSVFLLDEILIADDSIKNDLGTAPVVTNDTIVAAVIPHENEVTEDSYTLNPELGRTVTYQPFDDIRPYMIESFPDPKLRTNFYDGVTRSAVVEFNAMAKRIINAANASFNASTFVSISGGTIVAIDGGTTSA